MESGGVEIALKMRKKKVTINTNSQMTNPYHSGGNEYIITALLFLFITIFCIASTHNLARYSQFPQPKRRCFNISKSL